MRGSVQGQGEEQTEIVLNDHYVPEEVSDKHPESEVF